MHIPLDYYRVLGLPIQATTEQLNHAHRDRTLQLPRREFSEWAIAARRQIIDEAYEILSDPIERPKYDASFLSKPYEMDPAVSEETASSDPSDLSDANDPAEADAWGESPEGVAQPAALPQDTPHPEPAPLPRIEIEEHQFIGALLLLYELGEYELALKLGRPYLSSGGKSLSDEKFGDPKIVAADIVLTIALSCLELGREQWQQGQYEAAAESLETGQELLLREGLFASVRGEIQSDLYKLRPYRILELLALPEERSAERYQGLRLLSDILQERGGIDGKTNDQSGLNTDDFLRFIQQLRGYLTVAEQQQIFEAEAKRPSAVGTYLSVYTLIAGGFARRQPARIQSAKTLLGRLGHRQDIRLEQSVCALLLGQTEDANYLVEQSQEEDTLTYIRKHSEGSPDLLPGLCLYTEQWLRVEVFPQFRDLREEDASLKGYFADPTVQAYLESLPTQEADSHSTMAYHTAPQQRGNVESHHDDRDRYSTVHTADAYQRQPAAVGAGASATATRNRDNGNGNGNGASALHSAERVSRLSPEGSLSRPAPVGNGNGGHGAQPPHFSGMTNGTTITPRTRSSSGPRIDRLLLLAALGILGLLIMWILASRMYGWISQMARPPLLPGEQLELQVNQAPVPIPDSDALPVLVTETEGELTTQGAERVILSWLGAKRAAMGPDYDTALLEDVLIDGPLARWQRQSALAQQNDFYLTYEHPDLTVEEVTWSEDAPDEATIQISITEVGDFYKGGELDGSQSYNTSLDVVYGVVRDGDRWKIQTISTQ